MSEKLLTGLASKVSPADEYAAARANVAIADISDRGRLEVGGDDRVKFLNNLSTNDIPKIAIGGGAEAFFLDARGRILDYAAIFGLPEAFWLDTEPGRAALLLQHLDKYLIREKVTLTDRSAATAQLHLAGPNARALLTLATDAECPELLNLQHMARTIAGHPCQVRCHARSPYGGFDILTATDAAKEVAARLVSLGGDLGICPIGAATMEILRVEAGLPVYGRDITEANFPQEVGRDATAISFTKGCYIGQETVARIDSYGHVNRILRGIVLDEKAEVAVPAAVRAGAKEIGSLTTAVESPKKQATIGLAILRKGGDAAGTKVEIVTEAGPIQGTVTDLPFE